MQSFCEIQGGRGIMAIVSVLKRQSKALLAVIAALFAPGRPRRTA